MKMTTSSAFNKRTDFKQTGTSATYIQKNTKFEQLNELITVTNLCRFQQPCRKIEIKRKMEGITKRELRLVCSYLFISEESQNFPITSLSAQLNPPHKNDYTKSSNSK